MCVSAALKQHELDDMCVLRQRESVPCYLIAVVLHAGMGQPVRLLADRAVKASG